MVSVKVAAALVQVGTNLWVNPAQVLAVRPCDMDGRTKACTYIEGPGPAVISTDWPLLRVLQALGESGKTEEPR